jgi:transcription elongation factor Elf1
MSTKSTKSITRQEKLARTLDTSGVIQDISTMRTMRTMKRYWYLHDNYKVCACCNEEKRLTAFWDKQNNTINDNCTRCNKKLYEIEVMKIVLGVLKKSEVF